MRVLLQRVSQARVEVEGVTTGEIGQGLLLLVGMSPDDDRVVIDLLAAKVAGLRIFEDAEGRMNRAAEDLVAAGEPCAVLVVSQFTLYGDVRKGRRPSFTDAARPEVAQPAIASFCETLRERGFQVEEGVFGAHMQVTSTNDGPVTIWLDSDDLRRPRRGGTEGGS
ncbi:MAG TPA: D-aminoacyl-tRNA deacylase [Thermomicrobiales bacterium]|nr:D-aminoacyl-tRNA deacylase [Thermomicrobiales bacterium]